jgi:hypothetical protein
MRQGQQLRVAAAGQVFAPATTATGKGRPPAYRAEAVSLAANFLGSAGVKGLRIVDLDENSPFDAAWSAEDIFGMVRIELTEKPELISAIAIAGDAAASRASLRLYQPQRPNLGGAVTLAVLLISVPPATTGTVGALVAAILP